ncbi:MAG TPA: MFS transporter [Vicinamibacteria bacterium]|nr:MFS transporter [Vicinamibacteria bacterium]
MSGYLSLGETAALILSLFFVGVSFGGSSPLVSSILESRGESEYFTSGVVAMLSLGLALASPWAGRLVDRVGPRPVNVAGILLQGIGFAGLALALATDARLLLPARLWLGVAAALTFVAAEYALLKGTRPSHRGRVMAAYGAAFGGGFMLGVFLGNRAYDELGLAGFLAIAGIAFGIAPLALWGMRRMPVAEDAAADGIRVAFPARRVVLALYGAVVYAVLDVAMIGTYPVEGQRLGLSRREALDVVGWMAFGTVAIQPFAGWLADAIGKRRVLVGLAGLGIAASIAAGDLSSRYLPQSLGTATLAFVLVGAAVGGIFPVSLALLAERTPAPLLSRANALFSTVFGYASLAGPMVAALFIDLAERAGLLGWAVPALSLVTFGAVVPLAIADHRVCAPRDSDVVENDDAPLLARQEKSDYGEAG